MKILQVNKFYYPWIGGVEDHVKTLTENLANKHQLTVLTVKNSAKKKLLKNNYRLIECRNLCHLWEKDKFFSLPLSFEFIFKFRELIKNQDIVHLHLPNPLAVITVLFFSKAKNLVVTYHSDIRKQRFFLFFYRPLLKRFLKTRVAKIVTTSDNLKNNSKILKKFADKTTVVPLGIDLTTLTINQEFLQKLQKKYSQTPVVLFVGRLVYYKGCEYLIRAFKKVNSPAKLIIIGEGVLKKRLKKITEQLGLSKKVIFVGNLPKDRLNAYYKLADIFVLPSVATTEAYGLVQLEAMYHQTAIISTDLPTGVPFVNQDQITGYTVPVKSSLALAKKIDTLLSDKKTLTKFKNKARQRVINNFTVNKMIIGILKVYQEIRNN